MYTHIYAHIIIYTHTNIRFIHVYIYVFTYIYTLTRKICVPYWPKSSVSKTHVSQTKNKFVRLY